jgi:hypothetical protein
MRFAVDQNMSESRTDYARLSRAKRAHPAATIVLMFFALYGAISLALSALNLIWPSDRVVVPVASLSGAFGGTLALSVALWRKK